MINSIRNFFFRISHSSRARKLGREHLRLAKTGDHEQYLALAANYIDLAQAFFGTTMAEGDESRRSRTEAVFLRLWEQLRYAERLSDFEYMLATALFDQVPPNCDIAASEPMVTKIRLLPSRVRFAFVAYEFENWPLKWVALVMRQRPQSMHRMLSEARCELCGISWESLCDEERNCLEAISESLDKRPNLRANKQLQQRISTYPRISQIKALWLELRPDLVEVRMRFKPSQSHREQILKNIFNGINTKPMLRPPIVDRMVNRVHFSRQRKIKAS